MTFDAGLLKATFDQYTNEFGENLSGRDQAHAPRYMASAGIRFSHGRWKATLTADTKDEFYFSDRHGVKVKEPRLRTFPSYIFQHPGKLSCGQGISEIRTIRQEVSEVLVTTRENFISLNHIINWENQE